MTLRWGTEETGQTQGEGGLSDQVEVLLYGLRLSSFWEAFRGKWLYLDTCRISEAEEEGGISPSVSVLHPG